MRTFNYSANLALKGKGTCSTRSPWPYITVTAFSYIVTRIDAAYFNLWEGSFFLRTLLSCCLGTICHSCCSSIFANLLNIYVSMVLLYFVFEHEKGWGDEMLYRKACCRETHARACHSVPRSRTSSYWQANLRSRQRPPFFSFPFAWDLPFPPFFVHSSVAFSLTRIWNGITAYFGK